MAEKSPMEMTPDETWEANKEEIEAETSKPFEKSERLKDVDRYYEMKKREFYEAQAKVARMFPRVKTSSDANVGEKIRADENNIAFLAQDVSDYCAYKAHKVEGTHLQTQNKRILERISSLPEFRFIEALAEVREKIEAGREVSREVLDRREKNEMKKKEDALLAEIGKI